MAVFTKAPVQEIVVKELGHLMGDMLARQYQHMVVATEVHQGNDTQYRLTLNVFTNDELRAYVNQKIKESNDAIGC